MLVNKLKKYQWLIFDADNTLFNYDVAEKYALLKTLDDFNIVYEKKSIIETYHAINHKIWQQFEQGLITSQEEIKRKRTKQLFAALNADNNVMAFADDYLYNLSQNGTLLNNALKITEILSKNHQLALMTNGMTKVQKPRFAASPISQYFKHIIISEEIKHSKPSKEIFDHAFELMQQPHKNSVLMIGDNLGSDIQGGINYNIDTVWYNPNQQQVKHQATYEIQNLLEFIAPINN